MNLVTREHTCDTEIDEYSSQRCLHGLCIDGVNGFECDCNSGFMARQCEMEIEKKTKGER